MLSLKNCRITRKEREKQSDRQRERKQKDRQTKKVSKHISLKAHWLSVTGDSGSNSGG